MSTRPYRLYDALTKTNLRWRYYSDPHRAHMGALIECRWSKVGSVIEVLNNDTGHVLGTYKRSVHSLTFTKG